MFHTVDRADQQEDGERHNDEADHGVDENTDINGRRTGFLGGSECFKIAIGQVVEEIAEIDIAKQDSNWRHDDVGDQRRDDFAERSADNDTGRHVDDIATHGKFTKFFEHDDYSPDYFS